MAHLALSLSLIFSLWLLIRDSRRRVGVSLAVWVPILLLLILGSRRPAQWITGGIVTVTEMGNDASSSPLDASVFVVIIAASVLITTLRGMRWQRIFAANPILLTFYFYFLLSVLWSGDPSGSIKRLIKDFGLIFVAGVIFSERSPLEAMRAVYFRCAAVLLPLSIVFIKYFPDYGRAYTITGGMMFTGVTTQKNSLGEIVLLFTLFLVWDCIESRQSRSLSKWLFGIWDRLILLAIGLRLLQLSQSKTAMLCVGIGVFLVWRNGWLVTKPINRLIHIAALALPFLVFFSQEFSTVIAPIVEAMGRNMTFTGRTDIWNHITLNTVNPLIGAGFWNFWGGPGGYAISQAMLTVVPNAHCGYVDIYLDGGILGIALLFAVLIGYGQSIISKMQAGADEHRYLRVRFSVLIVLIIYNLSESTFARIGPIWFTALLMLVNFPGYIKGAASAGKLSAQKALRPKVNFAFHSLGTG